jgi:hypothetical protein
MRELPIICGKVRYKISPMVRDESEFNNGSSYGFAHFGRKEAFIRKYEFH